MCMTTFTPEQLTGQTAVDATGAKIGKIGQVYLDDRTGQPTWVTVSTGLFGSKESFAPLYGASASGDDLVLSVTKDQVKDEPHVDSDGHIDDDEARALYDYYLGIFGTDADWTGWQTGSGIVGEQSGPAGRTGAGVAGHDVSAPSADDAMTRSEEQLHVGTEQVEAGRARLRKYVVTENVTTTVPVSHEEVRIEREPITDANVGEALDGPAISDEEHEVVLHAERPVVEKEAVPVERVRLDVDTVTEQETVSDSVRKEQIETDDVES